VEGIVVCHGDKVKVVIAVVGMYIIIMVVVIIMLGGVIRGMER
jgi:hypothetical protein